MSSAELFDQDLSWNNELIRPSHIQVTYSLPLGSLMIALLEVTDM